MKAFALIALASAVGYLICSINFAVIITKIIKNRDIREIGSGNAGATNVIRAAGFGPGLLTFILDFAKAAISCLIAKYLVFGLLGNAVGADVNLTYGLLVCGVFCQIGHIYPVFFTFRGGKAVSVTAGIFAVCNWKVLVICVAVFGIVFFCTKMVSAASISSMIALPFAEFFTVPADLRPLSVTLSAAIALIVIVKHRSNIIRIFKKQEPKFNIRGRKNDRRS